MGCTSSAPAMAPANATERNISFMDEEDNQTEEIKEMETRTQATVENKVLPKCDNLDETILLSEADKSTLETASQRIDKDVQTDNFRIGNDGAWSESYRILQENKEECNTPKLEEVVEQVVEMLNANNTEGGRNTPEQSVEAAPETSEAPVIAGADPELDENNEHLEEMMSPSLSESSRATRWEALADIAAELPPSLAVDPLTGQIYTLK